MSNVQPLTSRLRELTEAFLREFDSLNAEELNHKPDPNTWSIAQNIDHLIRVNETYFPIVGKLRKGTYRTPLLGRVGFLVNFFGKTVLNSVQPSNPKTIRTFPIWEPSLSDLPADILQQFEQHQAKLIRLMEDADVLIGQGVVIASPASQFIVYKLERAFEIIIAHEERHLEQAKKAGMMA